MWVERANSRRARDRGLVSTRVGAYVRTLPLAIGVAALSAWVFGFVAVAEVTSGYLGLLAASAFYALPGMFVGTVIGMLSLAAATIPRRPVRVAVVILLTLGVLLVGWATPFHPVLPQGWIVLGGAALAPVIQCIVAEWWLVLRGASVPDWEPSSAATGAFLGAGVAVAVVAGPLLLFLVRETFHYGCSWLVGGEAGNGSWTCSDGVGYIAPALGMPLPIAIALIGGAYSLLFLRRRVIRSRMLFFLALVPILSLAVMILYAAGTVARSYPDAYGDWTRLVLPAVVLCLLGTLVLLCLPILGERGGRAGLWAGVALFAVAVVAQPMLISATVATAALAASGHAARFVPVDEATAPVSARIAEG
jgi:hypothetical protein